jgi:DNA replication protein DnaC
MIQTLQLGQKPGAYIRGPVGCGKTHLMKAILNHLINWKIDLESKNQHSPMKLYWISMSAYLDELRKEKFDSKKKAKDATVLFIDDIGTSTKTDWVTDQVFQLIDYRAERSLQTFLTSNLKVSDLEPIYGDRVVSRICSMCIPVELVGSDHRMQEMKNNFDNVVNIMNNKRSE